MADYQQKPNTGAIFKNEKKQKDTHPDYRGTIDVDGVPKEISLWVKKSKAGKSYFSVAVAEPFVPNSAQNRTPANDKPINSQSTNNQIVDDDLPF